MTSDEPRYTLLATAGHSYDRDSHQQVIVNGNAPVTIETDHAIISLWVRIQDYAGLPASSPSSHSYFSHPAHINDQYSISISFVPKRNIPGAEVVFGNDFPHRIADRLPTGTSFALRFVKWWIDPGIESDPYGDEPYLYGPALSSWNYFRICGRCGEECSQPLLAEGGNNGQAEATGSSWENSGQNGGQDSVSISKNGNTTGTDPAAGLHGEVIEEGSEGSGKEIRAGYNIPDGPDMRRRFFLEPENRAAFVFEAGRIYKADFGNPYLGFSDFTLRLPGFSVDVSKYIDKKNHELRYVLKNKATGDIYFVLLFTLLLNQQQAETEDEPEENEEENEVD